MERYREGTYPYRIAITICILSLGMLLLTGAGSASLELTQEERQYILERPLVRTIGVEGYAPVLDVDSAGHPVGITLMVLEEIAAITGLMFEVTMYENIESTPYIDRDEFDAYLAVPQSFVQLIPNGALSERYLSSSSIIYANTSIPFDDLQGRRFAAIRDGTLPEGIAEEDVVYFDTRKECIKGVNSGLADYGFGNAFSVHYYVLEHGLRNLMTIPLEREPRTYHLVFVNQDPLLVSVIDKAIQSIDDNTMQNIILSSISRLDRQPTLQEVLRMYGVEISLTLAAIMSFLIIALIIYSRSNHKIKTQAADLSRNQELLQQSQSIAHLGSWTLDLETYQLDWSDEVYRIFGLEPQQIAATYEAFLEFVHPDDRDMVDKAYMESVENRSDTYDIEHRIVNAETGDTRYVHQKCVHVRDDAGTVISSRGMVHDITQQKHAQRLLQARLNLIEVSQTSSLEGVLQEALDEACDLTNSTIGFYHLVDADEKSLTSKAWSTRTLQEFCQIEGKDTHYDMDEAGVWVDCVRQRKPIIHNDYGSIPHRKGMPEGHAPVTRELVVPIMRRDRIVAVLGDGNKPQDYSEKDLDTILYFADVAWEIVERKQAEEALQLERQRFFDLMEDSLAGYWDWDLVKNSEYLSPAFKRMFGYEDHELPNSPETWQALILPDDLADVLERFNHHVKSRGRESFYNEVRYRHKNGTIVWVICVGRVVEWDGDRPLRMIGCHIDITDRKQAEERVRVSTIELENLYRVLDEEMQSARSAHQRLVQQQIPEFDKVSLTACSHPATYIGGDFAQAVRRDDLLVLYITDITGHGLEGTIFSLYVKDCIESYLDLVSPLEITPDRILKYLSQKIHQGHYPSEYAVAIFLMTMNVVNGEVAFSAAGFQNSPVLVHEDGSIEMLEYQGLPISPDIPLDIMEFEPHLINIAGNTFVFLATDGIYEQRSGDEIYEQRLLSLLQQYNNLPHSTIADIVNLDFRDFLGDAKQEDDVTFAVLSTVEVEEHTLPSSLDALHTVRDQALLYYKDHPQCVGILMAVHELVANGIEHGNKCDAIKHVKVLLSSKAIVVEDEGDGFDWKTKVRKELSLDLDQERGRGIAMTQMFVGQLVYNEKGNRVSLLLAG